MSGDSLLLSIGTAVPDAVLTQTEAAAHAALVRDVSAEDGRSRQRALRALYSRAGIESRGTVLGGDRADLNKAEAEGEHGVRRFGVLVEACGDADDGQKKYRAHIRLSAAWCSEAAPRRRRSRQS